MKRIAVLNIVGLSQHLVGADTPFIRRLADHGKMARIRPAFPAVTCTAQSNYVTGLPPSRHGIVANGWYNRELAEAQFWKQSNHLVQAPKVWEMLRKDLPEFTCAKLFWWYNMYSTADYSITPRPIYPADGRKVFDIYTHPLSIREEIKKDLGEFPFPAFWGPAAGVKSPQGPPDAASQWIAQSAKWIEERFQPTLSLVYLPHLDYNFQRLGPEHPAIIEDLKRIDVLAEDLISYFHTRGVAVIVLSEYGITPVDTPVHLNRLFREKGWITIKEELGLELLDCGASQVFAVADHQIAHIYVNDPNLKNEARALLESQPAVAQVLASEEKRQWQLDHPRAGDLVAVAAEKAWFTYYYWLDDRRAPDFARCVDIHRKPGYDPVELFLDPKQKLIKGKILWRLLEKKLGFRMLMDVIPLDAGLVKGSHGRPPVNLGDFPVLITDMKDLAPGDELDSTDVCQVIEKAVRHK
jgi:predicted AlkP superfamily pyrophosphatase or phosphodiesterase